MALTNVTIFTVERPLAAKSQIYNSSPINSNLTDSCRFLRQKLQVFLQSSHFQGKVTDEDLTAMLLTRNQSQAPQVAISQQTLQSSKLGHEALAGASKLNPTAQNFVQGSNIIGTGPGSHQVFINQGKQGRNQSNG